MEINQAKMNRVEMLEEFYIRYKKVNDTFIVMNVFISLVRDVFKNNLFTGRHTFSINIEKYLTISLLNLVFLIYPAVML